MEMNVKSNFKSISLGFNRLFQSNQYFFFLDHDIVALVDEKKPEEITAKEA
jgi:hypothetical protein